MKYLLSRALTAFIVLSAFTAAAQEPAEELSAESFVRAPAIWAATISPDGQHVAAIQHSALGDVLTIIDWRTRTARAIQLARREDSLRLDWVDWKNDDQLIFALRQESIFQSGRRRPETTRVFTSRRDGSAARLMFSGELGRRLGFTYAPVWVIDLLAGDPDNVLLGAIGQHGYTIYRTNVATGRVNQIVDYGDWDTVEMIVDGDGYPVMRVDLLSDNSGWRFYRRPQGRRDWVLAHEVRRATSAQNRDFFPLGRGPGRNQVYVAARPEGEEYEAIYIYDTESGELGEPVFRHERADAEIAWLDRSDRSILVGCGETTRRECRANRPDMQRHFDGLAAFFGDDVDFELAGMSADENYWLLSVFGPRTPNAYYVYDAVAREASFLASTQPSLSAEALAPMRVVEYRARDGMPLWGYLTEPAGPGPHPLVVHPHGGPEVRDSYTYDFYVQFLASRGYAVFQPNFRGSEGSGRSFARAGHRQWGRAMQDDITDGVQHLIGARVVDPNRVCIVGASYGGYAALAGVSLTPDLYRCAISIAGVSDLVEMLREERREQGRASNSYAYWTRLIGDPNQDQSALIAVSPSRLATHVQAPVLLLHGVEDNVVPLRQSELMEGALQRAGKRVNLVRIEDEGHYWAVWTEDNRRVLLEQTEQFLMQHLSLEPDN